MRQRRMVVLAIHMKADHCIGRTGLCGKSLGFRLKPMDHFWEWGGEGRGCHPSQGFWWKAMGVKDKVEVLHIGSGGREGEVKDEAVIFHKVSGGSEGEVKDEAVSLHTCFGGRGGG